MLWTHLDPVVIAEVDIYHAQVAGQDPAAVIAALGPRAELVHIRDGPAVLGEPTTLMGTGRVDIPGALAAGEYLRWHILELEERNTDIFDSVAKSAAWLVDHGLSTAR